MKRNPSFFILFLLQICALVNGQNQPEPTAIDNVLNSFDYYNQSVPVEKIYLHTDKDYYTLGENIWFKGYLVNGENKPDTLSKIVYAELINEEKEVIQQRMLKVENSVCAGDFLINDSLSPGTYLLRAYTNYMRNFGNEFFFHKSIPVFSAGYKQYNWMVTPVQSDTIDEGNFLYKIELRDKQNQPVTNFPVEYKVKAKRLKAFTGEQNTDDNGNFYIELNNPPEKQMDKCALELSFPNEKQKWVYNLSLQKEQPAVGFFPEGGNLVQGIENHVAVKVTNSNGLGISGRLRIFNQDSILITEVNCNHLGLGSFTFIPNDGEEYFSYLEFNNLDFGRYSLPVIEKKGYVLRIDNLSDDSVYIWTARNFDRNFEDTWTLLCQTKGKMIYKLQGISCDGELIASFPKTNLPTGVFQITLFDQNVVPQCERVIFIQPESDSDIDLELDKQQTQNRNQLFTGKLNDKVMQSANLSVSVINKDIVEDLLPYNDNIYSYLQLSSELNGRIESPGYYFKDDSLQTRTDLDYLLMTQGWRKFVWEKILEGNPPKFNYSIERAIKISGKISNYSKRGKKNEEVTLMLFEKGNNQVYQCISDSLGRFIFFADFNDTVKALVQTRKKKSNVERRLTLDEKTAPVVDNFVSLTSKIKDNEQVTKFKKSGEVRELVEKLYEFGTDKTIEEVTVKGVDRSHNYKLEPQKVIMVEELEEEIKNRNNYEYPNVLHFIADNYNGTSVRKFGNLPWDFLFVGNHVALIVLDNKPMVYADHLRLLELDWRSLQKVEIYNWGAYNFYSHINCQTPVVLLISNPDGITRVKHIGIRKFDLTGYYRARKFYQPVTSEDVKANIPEYRSTVYWNPELKCNSKGIFNFEIENKYLPPNISIILEGITDYGRPIVGTFDFPAN